LIEVVADREPEVPVMITVAVPEAAVLLAFNVSTLAPVVGFVAKAAVTPLGNPDALSATLPVNPPTSVTAIVSVALPPGTIDRAEAEGESVKLPPPLQVTPFKANDVGTAFVTLFHVPLKPTLVRLPPAGMPPS
jgi:hypothetical protein